VGSVDHMTINGDWIIDLRSERPRVALPEIDTMERTHAGFRVLRALAVEQERYFGADSPGIASHRNSADAVETLYL